MRIFETLVGPTTGLEIREMDPIDAPTLQHLHPQEAALMARAVEKRRLEFAAGRTMAREALVSLGFPQRPLLRGDDRAPIWPEGAVGSITHTRGHCAVAVGRQSEIRAVGIDIEQAAPLKQGVYEAITTAREREILRGDDALQLGKVVFSVKECAYKAQYALTAQYLPFSAMWVVLRDDGTWRATFNVSAGTCFEPGDVIEGRFRLSERFVATACVLR